MGVLAIFVLGVIVSGITLAGALAVGISEAGDPAQSRPEDLTEFEKEVVDRGDLG